MTNATTLKLARLNQFFCEAVWACRFGDLKTATDRALLAMRETNGRDLLSADYTEELQRAHLLCVALSFAVDPWHADGRPELLLP